MAPVSRHVIEAVVVLTFVHLILVNVIVAVGANIQDDSFTEELLIKPLSRGFVYSHFQFTTKWNASVHDSDTFQHYHLFPRSLGEVLARHQVQELHLSQTQGLWRHKLWGYPVHDAPPGAELWVWFKPSVDNVDQAWANLVNALSGLFCSSLNFLDSKNTIRPRWSFRPQGIAGAGYAASSHFVRHGTLPREIVCTENLTPWKKLLPCDSRAGLTTLFNAFHFHDSYYHSLGLRVRPVCSDVACTKEAIEVSQSLGSVKEVFSTGGSGSWNLRSLFGNHLASVCPVAAKSSILVDVTGNEESQQYNLSPAPSSTHTVTRGPEQHTYSVYDLQSLLASGRALNIGVLYHTDGLRLDSAQPPPPIYLHRYITGYGLDKGGVSCLIYNTLTVNQSVVYLDTLPWFTRVFFNTLTVDNNGTKLLFKVHYVPGKDRSRPHHLELNFNLWPNSVTRVYFSFTRAFLKWTEYPPDANHGFYISSATLTAILPSSRGYSSPPILTSSLESILWDNSSKFPVRLHSESLLVSLPTPDFSMPYNVICLACTVVAIAFGSIHNLTTKRFRVLDPTARKGLLTRIKSFFLKKKTGQADEVTEQVIASDGEVVKPIDGGVKKTSRDDDIDEDDKPKVGVNRTERTLPVVDSTAEADEDVTEDSASESSQ